MIKTHGRCSTHEVRRLLHLMRLSDVRSCGHDDSSTARRNVEGWETRKLGRDRHEIGHRRLFHAVNKKNYTKMLPIFCSNYPNAALKYVHQFNYNYWPRSDKHNSQQINETYPADCRKIAAVESNKHDWD